AIHYSLHIYRYFIFFFFNDPAPTEIYTLSLHDALPIYRSGSARRRVGLLPPGAVERRSLEPRARRGGPRRAVHGRRVGARHGPQDRKSTRLNSSHVEISYAVFCLKKKKIKITNTREKSA